MISSRARSPVGRPSAPARGAGLSTPTAARRPIPLGAIPTYDEPEANQRFRIDLVEPSAPIDSVAQRDVLVRLFKTSAGDPDRPEPSTVSVDASRWAGRTVRLRLAATDNSGPLRAGVDDIRYEPIGANANARIELPDPKQPARALNLVLHRMTEADALNALSARADKLASKDELSGAVLVAKDDRVLFSHAYGLADRNRQIPNTLRTRFRIGSMKSSSRSGRPGAGLTSQQFGDQGGGAACAVGLDGLAVCLADDLVCDRLRDDVGW
jgi:hypothetical protein